ncbi:helix-turn-helix transcriptional regulator [Sinorhizobium medicae]|uniref:helix-turn-helix domain-containing protein n=1 Tax=Sinorhizobium medicae TaxID=110321 RepID=UPI002AF6A0A8|nr:helix-turn-helix transcriptional regulator [Sinorhizobium medicae]WQO44873.1 helix-turn-helix transcriptional regulator [Sinorhizobium medicae]WQO65029.1 helix-turn-helix transcriptional regulator [Sinorhizobium medicae]WQO72115.1 helix-turn-helix transcriptional regulator [Sinorhizobium medicae]WQO91460.1 helix-turn-helix transcriptional regulator [Sinorhizobium medicae]
MAISDHLVLMENLGDRIRDASGEVDGLKRLSELIDVPRRTLGHWLTGTQPKPEHLQKIADVTGVQLHWLITGEGPKKEDPISKAMQRLLKLSENPGGLTNDEVAERYEEEFRAGMQKFRGFEEEGSSFATPKVSLDIALLQRLSDLAQSVFNECKQSAPPRAITAEAGNLYNELLQMVVDVHDEEVVEALLPVLRARFKKRLQEAASQPGSGKRSA